MASSINRKYITYRNAIRGPSHGHRATSMKNLVKFGCTVFELCEQSDRQIDRQTHKQTDIPITILRNPTGAK